MYFERGPPFCTCDSRCFSGRSSLHLLAELGAGGGWSFSLCAELVICLAVGVSLFLHFFGVFFLDHSVPFSFIVDSLSPCFCCVAFDGPSLASLVARPLLNAVAAFSTPAHSYVEHRTSHFNTFHVSFLFFVQVKRIKILLLVSHVLLVTQEHDFDLDSGSTVASQAVLLL